MENETVKEIAKLGTAVVEFANRVIGGPLEQVGGLAQDQLGYWRAKRQMKLGALLGRARELFAAHSPEGLPELVPPKLLEPILRDATLEDDPELSEMWASLLAAAADPKAVGAIQPSFASILKDLTPQGASVLQMLYLRARRHGERRPIRPQKVRGRCGLDVETYERVLDHLLVSGLVRVPSDIFVVARAGAGGPPGAAEDKTTRLALVLTASGFAFVCACYAGREPAVPEGPDDGDEDGTS